MAKKYSRYEIALLFLLVGHFIAYVLFRILDNAYQTWDSAGHLAITFQLADKIYSFLSGGSVTIIDLLKHSNYYPPLVHFVFAAFSMVFGYNVQVLLFLMLCLFLVTLILLFKIVKMLGYDEKTAFWTVFFFSLLPQVADQARLFHLEIPLILALFGALYLLLKSNRFKSTKYTTLFFAVLGVIQLIKWYGFLFMVVPVLYVLYLRFREKTLRQIVLNLAVGAVVAVLIAAPWYLANFNDLLKFSSIFSTAEVDDPAVLLSIQNFFYYLKNISSHQIFVLPFFVSLLGLARLLRVDKKRGFLVALYVLFVLAVFTVIPNKNLRYVLPLTPIYAFLISYLFSIGFNPVKPAFWFVSSYAALAFVFTSFNQVEPASLPAKIAGYIFEGSFYDGLYYTPQMYSYDNVYTPVGEVLDFIVEDARERGATPIGVTPLIDEERMSAATLEAVRLEKRYKTVYFPTPYFQFDLFDSDAAMLKFLNDANVSYVIVPDTPGPEGLRNYKALKQMGDFMKSKRNVWFETAKKFDGLPNNIAVYKRIKKSLGVSSNSCEVMQNFSGELAFPVAPGTSYVVFAGHFASKNTSRNFEEGTLNILEIGNGGDGEWEFTVGNMPVAGISVCYRNGVRLDLTQEINAAFENPTSCGVAACKRVVHTRINNAAEVEEKAYAR